MTPTPYNMPNVSFQKIKPKKFERKTIDLDRNGIRRSWKNVWPMQVRAGDTVAHFGLVKDTSSVEDFVVLTNVFDDNGSFKINRYVKAFVIDDVPGIEFA